MTTPPSLIHSVYRTPIDGSVLLYAGDLIATREDGEARTVRGDVRLTIAGNTALRAYVADEDDWLFVEPIVKIDLPPASSLAPPSGTAVPVQPSTAMVWHNDDVLINRLTAGEPRLVERVIVHVTGALGEVRWPYVSVGEVHQYQIPFQLPGWTLRIARTDEAGLFDHVIEATPDATPVGADDIEALRRRLFTLLSLVRGTATGVAPLAGVDASGEVVWVEWAAPRVGSTYSRHLWCWPGLVPAALPAVAQGFAKLAADQGLEQALDRAVGLLNAANGAETVVDARIPIACSGLELMAWAVLQHKGWLTTETTRVPALTAMARLRLLLKWAGIPTELPTGDFIHLADRARRLNRAGDEGPESVVGVRNRLVHPPKDLRDPEWPDADEMVETWDLALWYLELVILRVLGYAGQYGSRLRRRAWIMETEAVPWAPQA